MCTHTHACVCYVTPPRCTKLSQVIYDPMVGSSQFFFMKFTLLLTFYKQSNYPLWLLCTTVYATLCEQFCTIIDNVIRHFFDCPKVTLYKDKASLHITITVSITSKIREQERSNQDIYWQHQVPILRHLCVNLIVVYPEIFKTRTTKLSRPEDGFLLV